jgi:hypothetical protein
MKLQLIGAGVALAHKMIMRDGLPEFVSPLLAATRRTAPAAISDFVATALRQNSLVH